MKVLIVDDEPLVRKSLGRAFRAKGHDVTEAVDGREGLRLWLELMDTVQSPQIVLLDVLMPGLSGPELLNEIRPHLKDWGGRVILMSAYSGEHNVTTAHQVGADLFIPKPFDDVFALVKSAEDLSSAAANTDASAAANTDASAAANAGDRDSRVRR